MDWYKLTSKPSEANSGTYANIYQGFISNLGLNHMQYAVFTSHQTKNVWFVPLIRNMNCAITYIYIHKELSCLWQVHPWFKDKYIGANHLCVCLTVARPTNWQRSWQVFMCHILPKYCGKIYIVFYIFHFQKYTNSCDSFNKEYVDVIW